MGSKSQELIEIAEQWGAHNYSPLPVVLSRGENATVWDVDGNRFIDFLSGYSAINFGHSNPFFIDAARRQLEQLTLSSRAFYNDQFGPFCHELCELLGFNKALVMNSGAEAVETALKAARRWALDVKGIPDGEAEIIVMDNNFSGRTISIVSFSTVADYRRGFGPLTPGFKVVRFGDLSAVAEAITPRTAAVMFEPIQGEGGVIVPPPGYIRALREITSQANVLLMADEVQTGLCRTGAVLCCDHEGVKPDVVILGKSLGGGIVPISAVLASEEVMGVFNPGSHGSTFGGNPFACAIGRAVVEYIKREKPETRAARLGVGLLERLRARKLRHASEVRGKGMMIGIDIHPESGSGKDFCKRLMKRGVLCKDTRAQTVRLAPPLTIPESELESAVDVVVDVLDS
jgi:ornithine--oxo-acid transaminase